MSDSTQGEGLSTSENTLPEGGETPDEDANLSFDFDPFADDADADEAAIAAEDVAEPASQDEGGESPPAEPEAQGTEIQEPAAEPAEEPSSEPAPDAVAPETPEPVAADQAQPEAVAEPEAAAEPEPELDPLAFITKHHDAIVSELAKRVTVDEKTAENLQEHLPQIIAKSQTDMLAIMQRQIAAAVPSLVQAALTSRESNTKFEDRFFSAWPKLKGVEGSGDKIVAIGKALKVADPKLAGDAFIKQVGAAASVSLGLPIELMAEALGKSEVPVPHGSASPAQPGGQTVTRVVKQEHFAPAQEGGGTPEGPGGPQGQWDGIDQLLQSPEDDEL